MKTTIACILLLVLFLGIYPQQTSGQNGKLSPGGGFPDPQLSQKDNDYLDRQAAVFLDSVQSVLKKYPPVLREGRERTYAKLLLDAVFHEKFAAYRKPAQHFFHSQIDKMISELEVTKIKNGARIWKVYDMGFVVRTSTVTMAFDLVSGITSGTKDFALDSKELEELVSQCDVLFISHKHDDHAEKSVAEIFIKSGKPVIANTQVWPKDSIFPKIQHPERISEKTQEVRLNGNKTLKIVIYPGHQGRSIDNNVTLVTTPDGITVAHTGDELNEGDFMVDYEWIDQVFKHHKVDILMPNAWTMDILRIARGFDPKLVLPGHELELGHTVWDRLPYWGDDAYLELTYNQLKKSSYPVVALIWGESTDYKRQK